ncbi:MAG: extracellular solute-binding protein [Fusicatenibacter sp.]|nr:sugar ABC transporter substrate-binding protein [Fusicatenibacter sp.]
MKKRYLQTIGTISTLTLVCSLMAGCSSGSQNSTADKEQNTASSANTESQNTESAAGTESESPEELQANIRFSWWGGDERHTATINALEEFNKKYPGVKVDVEYQGYDGYHDKMFTQLAGGTAPDLFQYNPENMPEVVEAGKLLCLDEYVESGLLNLDSVSEGTVADCMIDGKLYGIPMSTQTVCIIYNKTLFEKAGVECPADDWTWDDYDRIVQELSEKLPEGVYPSTDLRVMDITTLSMVHQNGGMYLTPDGELNFADAIGEPLEKFQQYMEEGIVPPVEESLATTGDTIFMEGRAAIHGTFNAMATTLQAGSIDQDEYVLTSIPSANTGDRLGMYVKGEVAFCISADSENKEAAVTLLNEFINNPEMGRILGFSRGIPPSETIREELKKNLSGIDSDVLKVQAMADESKDTPEPRLMKGWMEVATVIREETDEYRYGRKDLATTIQDMTSRAQSEFAKAQ